MEVLKNKVAIVTGASRGIGAATAKLLAENGFDVCVNYKSNLDAANKVKNEIVQLGAKCITVKADVSDASQVEHLFNETEAALGPISVLVNNVGVLFQQCKMVEISEHRFIEVMKTNVLSCFLCSKAAVKRMSVKSGGQGGCIINVSSGASKSGSPNEYVDYAASKGAIDSLTRGLALEVAEEGIRVNAVRPGLIYTDMHASGGEANRVDRLVNKIPLKRGGKAEEVAEAIVWLASEKSSFITGSFIDPSGGL